jgi:hypothetical protein
VHTARLKLSADARSVAREALIGLAATETTETTDATATVTPA